MNTTCFLTVRSWNVSMLAAFSVTILAAIVGCAPTPLRAEIPFGQWEGRGAVVCEAWSDDGATESFSAHRDYPTTLTIRPGHIDGQDVIEIEINSDRGPLTPDDEDERTHLRAALVEAKRVSDEQVLYRLVCLQYNPEPGSALRIDDQAPPFGAACTRVGKERVLQIPYMDNFFDTYRFRGSRVEKSGVYFDRKSGWIHWTEELTPRK